MLQIDGKNFNPELLYIFDFYNDRESQCPRHSHDFLELSIMLEGESLYQVEEAIFPVTAGTILLFNPGVSHQETQMKHTYSHQLHIGFRHFSLLGYPRDYFPMDTATIVLAEHHDLFFQLCHQMIAEKNQAQLGADLMLKSLVMQLITLILREASPSPNSEIPLKAKETKQQKQTIVNDVIFYLEQHHQEELSLQDLAGMMYISPAYLSKVFKEETGESPIHFLIQIRLERAKQLLELGELTIKEAAQLVGYQDAYHFSKLFKKRYGQPPSAFVPKHLN